MSPMLRAVVRLISALAAALALGAHATRAADDPCREWRMEHRGLVQRILHAWLSGATQEAIDESVFELLQREAWLSSCDLSVDRARADLVGWRLVGRATDDYALAVVESVLDRAGFAPDLGHIFRRTTGSGSPDAPAR